RSRQPTPKRDWSSDVCSPDLSALVQELCCAAGSGEYADLADAAFGQLGQRGPRVCAGADQHGLRLAVEVGPLAAHIAGDVQGHRSDEARDGKEVEYSQAQSHR